MALQSAHRARLRSLRGSGLPEDRATALLEAAGPVEGLHVLVFGPGSLELMCELSRRGAGSVTILRHDRRVRPEAADVPFVLGALSIVALEPILAHVRRALRPLGTVCLRLFPDAPLASAREIDRLLVAQGFRPIDAAVSDDWAVLAAETALEVIQ